MADMNPENANAYQKALELLGRAPRSPFTVKTWCPDGTPQVLLANPVFLEDGIWKPFPAFLWLTCPRLKLQIALLEQDGLVRHFSQRLDTDEEFRETYLRGQKEITEIRIKMARSIYPGDLPEHMAEILKETTVAGSRNFRGVKCLHSQVAHELAFGGNPIGAEALKIIGRCKPEDICGRYSSTGEKQ